MKKSHILIIALLAASILIAGCTQQQPPAGGGQPAGEEITESAIGGQITDSEAADADLGNVDTTALDDVTGTL